MPCSKVQSPARRLLGLTVVVFSLLGLAQGTPASGDAAADRASCGGTHRPGERITCYVSFEADADFTSLSVQFNLHGEEKPRQHGTYSNLILRDATKISARTYAVSGVVPDCMPGTYVLSSIIARTSDDWQHYRNLDPLDLIIENDSPAPEPAKAPPSGSPEVTHTQPPEPNTFPRIRYIHPAPATQSPSADLVHLVRWIFNRPSPCGGTHDQGDKLACLIKFERHPQFTVVVLHFIRDEKRTDRRQSQRLIGFALGTEERKTRGKEDAYKVTATIPRCASGKYRGYVISAAGYSGGDSTKLFFKDYIEGTDYRTRIVLRVKDTSPRRFPTIQSVGNMQPVVKR